MEKIFYNNTLIAIRIKNFKNGTIPLTDPFQPLQILVHKRSAGSHTKAHIHKPLERTTQSLQECLIVIKGKIKIEFYTPDKKLFKYIYASSGEVVVFISGGHGVHILKDSEVIEVKNGPFVEDRIFIE